MRKKVVIKEVDIPEPAEESRDEIVQQVASEDKPADAIEQPEQKVLQKAESRTRVRELYKCEDCGKYLTKKSLNYSHPSTCRGNPENTVKQEEEEPEPMVTPYTPPPQPQTHLYEQMRMERRRQHLERISRLSQFIA